jgi:hypothetical protein
MAMHFRLSYITRDFYFGDAEIRVSDSSQGIDVVYKQRPSNTDEPPPFESYDGLIVARCGRNLSDRLSNEAAASGVLSLNKEAVKQVREDMEDLIQRTLRLARWKTNAIGGPNPIRMAPRNHFVWSADGSDWKMVADSISATLRISQIDRRWSKEDGEFLQTEIIKGMNEPLAHELLREADVNRQSNRRSSLILGVSAAEVGFKQFASKALPDTAWLLELPSPPLIEMLKMFPWAQLKLRINGKVPSIPEEIISQLRKAVLLRNKIVHSGAEIPNFETVDSILNVVKGFLYFLDMIQGNGQLWASSFLHADIISHFKKETA